MYFDSFADFLFMEGHGSFVFAAYGITLFIILLLVYLPLQKQKTLLSQLKKQQRFKSKDEEK